MGRYEKIFSGKSEGESVSQADKRQISLLDKPVDVRLTTDPRPDLTDDHHLWNDFSYLAAQRDEMLAGVLHGFRCMGTRLRKNSDGKFVLRPDIDSDGNRTWESHDAYNAAKERWLAGYRKEIVALLDGLRELAEG
jgi:hypothetical protein